MRIRHIGAALALGLLAVSCSNSSPSSAKPSPTNTRHYLHPTHDLWRVTADCDSDGEPYLTLWITNHSAHSLAYDIKYNLVDKSGKVVGSAGGVFTIKSHGVVGDTRLFDTSGRCGSKVRLAYVNAYVFEGHGNDQPSF